MESSKSETTKSKRERERKRLKKPKVKSGCKTCKIRRVKCDETRPECLRCQRFGKNYCDGYDYDSSAPGSRSQSRHREASSSSDQRPILPRKSSTSTQLSEPRRDLGAQTFNSEDEFRCFQFYREEVAPKLSSFNGSIWQGLLLQESQDQDLVRHALIAIGGFSRSIKNRSLESMEDEASNFNSARLRGFALEQYDQFLAGTKKQMALATREQGRRLAMISCLLVVCIENMQFHNKNALIHAQQGLKLVEELKNDTSDARNKGKMPESDFIENELVQQFDRLELQVLAIYDTRTGEEHEVLKDEGASSVENMPDAFTNIDDAKWYLDLIMRRAFHFMAYAQADKIWKLVFRDESDHTSAFDSFKGLSRALDTPNGLQVQQEIYVAENRRWSKAFEQLFRSSLKDINHLDAFRVLLMKVHSLTTIMRLNAHLSASELIWDSFASQMESVIGMCRTILNHPHADIVFGERSFSFDMGILYPVLTAAMCCRDRRLRREALDLLCTRPWREGQWMSLVCADLARFILETEEEGVETERIPEWARARLTGVDTVEENCKGTLHCVRGVGDSAVFFQSVRDWSGMQD